MRGGQSIAAPRSSCRQSRFVKLALKSRRKTDAPSETIPMHSMRCTLRRNPRGAPGATDFRRARRDVFRFGFRSALAVFSSAWSRGFGARGHFGVWRWVQANAICPSALLGRSPQRSSAPISIFAPPSHSLRGLSVCRSVNNICLIGMRSGASMWRLLRATPAAVRWRCQRRQPGRRPSIYAGGARICRAREGCAPMLRVTVGASTDCLETVSPCAPKMHFVLNDYFPKSDSVTI